MEGFGIQASGIKAWGECLPLPPAWEESLLLGLVWPGHSVQEQLTHVYARCPHHRSWYSRTHQLVLS